MLFKHLEICVKYVLHLLLQLAEDWMEGVIVMIPKKGA